DKPLTIATYAAGASLAAITLVYVFGPTFFLDGDGSNSVGGGVLKGGSGGRRAAVGLVNPANDCFINSVLQALAGLPDLRKYLIREIHRRKLGGPDLYKATPSDLPASASRTNAKSADIKLLKLEGLSSGVVTEALKDILDKLNERPIYKKTISAEEFVSALQLAFQTRISRNQQDAQEFLQVVNERLCEEYYAGRKARWKAKSLDRPISGELSSTGNEGETEEQEENDEAGFPFEGTLESQIECQKCSFKPRPAKSSFVTLTLSVPQRNHTTLNHCFDGLLKVETIDDFKCDKCRLLHALEVKSRKLTAAKDEKSKVLLGEDITQIERALEEDPEQMPKDVELPDLKLAPKIRIQRSTRLSSFPKILAIHLSRSIYSAAQLSTKNMAKVSFPEILPLGSIIDQKKYKLLGVVTHKGGHNSGHYETFRRQTTSIPFSTPHSFGTEGVYSARGSPRSSAVQSPRLSALESGSGIPASSTSTAQRSDTMSPTSPTAPIPGSAPAPASNTPSIRLSTSSVRDRVKGKGVDEDGRERERRKLRKKNDNKWWRISDDRVKESKTSEVLGMQKEVYLLFYSLME
ncbi:cysteine proteinase, partial [Tothia fuscella]